MVASSVLLSSPIADPSVALLLCRLLDPVKVQCMHSKENSTAKNGAAAPHRPTWSLDKVMVLGTALQQLGSTIRRRASSLSGFLPFLKIEPSDLIFMTIIGNGAAKDLAKAKIFLEMSERMPVSQRRTERGRVAKPILGSPLSSAAWVWAMNAKSEAAATRSTSQAPRRQNPAPLSSLLPTSCNCRPHKFPIGPGEVDYFYGLSVDALMYDDSDHLIAEHPRHRETRSIPCNGKPGRAPFVLESFGLDLYLAQRAQSRLSKAIILPEPISQSSHALQCEPEIISVSDEPADPYLIPLYSESQNDTPVSALGGTFSCGSLSDEGELLPHLEVCSIADDSTDGSLRQRWTFPGFLQFHAAYKRINREATRPLLEKRNFRKDSDSTLVDESGSLNETQHETPAKVQQIIQINTTRPRKKFGIHSALRRIGLTTA